MLSLKSNGGQVSEEEAIDTVKSIIMLRSGVVRDVFDDMKSRFTDNAVQGVFDDIKGELKRFYDNNRDDPDYKYIRGLILEITIYTGYAMISDIIDKKIPVGESTKTLDWIFKDVVSHSTPTEADANDIIKRNGHVYIASAVIADD